MVSPHAAVVLSGGAALAAYEVGVMKALFEGECASTNYQRLDPGIITGTSAGAINGAVLVSRGGIDIRQALEYLESVWLQVIAGETAASANGVFRVRLDPGQYTGGLGAMMAAAAGDGVELTRAFIRRGSNFALSRGDVAPRLIAQVDFTELISTEPLGLTLRRVIDASGITESNRQLRVVVTNWAKGEPTIFANSDFSDTCAYELLRASAAIPGIFAPVLVKRVPLVDGGLIMNTPLKPAIAAGAREIHIIYVDTRIDNIPLIDMSGALDVLGRSLAIAAAVRTRADVTTAREINEGIDAVGAAPSSRSLAAEQTKAIVRTVSRVSARLSSPMPYKKITIHQYHPRDHFKGLLDFSRAAIERLIERGFKDAIRHDCRASDCVIPV